MKIALINDTHFGARGDSPHFADYFRRFYKNIFFPYLDQHGIKDIIHLGDLVDRRKYINYVSCKNMREDFFEQAKKRTMTIHGIVGNHDSYHKNTLDVNALTELINKGKIDKDIKVYTTATEVLFDEVKILLVPWICNNNEEATLKLIKSSDAQILFGHLELAGFEMYKGMPSDHGTLDQDLLSKFDIVASGHFHHKSTMGNITYLGAPYEQNWSDYNDLRGFNIFDTATREIKHVKNPYKMFHKAFYSDKDMSTLDQVLDHRFDIYSNGYVKVIIKDLSHPEWLDVYIDRIEKAGALDVQTVDDHKHMDSIDTNVNIDEAESTGSVIKKYVNACDIKNKEAVFDCLNSLYQEALQLETTNS